MKLILTLLVLSVVTVTADTVWVYPFTELGADWEYGAWIPHSSGANLNASHSCTYGGSYSAIYNMTSGEMVLPAGFDSITIELCSIFHHSGYTMDGGVSISLDFDATTGAGFTRLFEAFDSHSTYEHSSFNVRDTTIVSETLLFDTDDTISLDFSAEMNGYGYLVYSSLYWSVRDMCITGHDGTGLNPETWAGIKSSF